MKKKIDGKMCDTETAKNLAFKYVGEFGQEQGYEEQLYLTKTGQHFIYGVGGPKSPYPKPEIKALTKEEAKVWEKSAKGE